MAAGLTQQDLASAQSQLQTLLNLQTQTQQQQIAAQQVPMEMTSQLLPYYQSLAEYQTPQEKMANLIAQEQVLKELGLGSYYQEPKTTQYNVFGSADTGYFAFNPSTGTVKQVVNPVPTSLTTKLDTSVQTVNNQKVLINNQTGDVIKVLGQTGTGDIDPNTLSKALSIASQFDNEPIVKNYNVIAEQVYANSTLGNTPTDDIARVYNFAKVMDPNSVVRESEYNTVQKYAQALFEAQGLKAKKVFDNAGFLTNEARNFMQNTLNSKLAASQKNYDNVFKEYGRRIENIGVDNGTDYLTNYSKAFKIPEAIGTYAKLEDGKIVRKVENGWEVVSPEEAMGIKW
jgi:hypothetical protein